MLHQQPIGRLIITALLERKGLAIWSEAACLLLPMTGDRKPYPFLASKYGEVHPRFSPDGHWLAYASNESGTWEVMVRPFPGPGEATQISSGGGWEPVWSPDAKTIYFMSLDGSKIFSASFLSAPRPEVGRPSLIVEGRFAPAQPYGRTYDIAPDGKRFLVWLRPQTPSTDRPLQCDPQLVHRTPTTRTIKLRPVPHPASPRAGRPGLCFWIRASKARPATQIGVYCFH